MVELVYKFDEKLTAYIHKYIHMDSTDHITPARAGYIGHELWVFLK